MYTYISTQLHTSINPTHPHYLGDDGLKDGHPQLRGLLTQRPQPRPLRVCMCVSVQIEPASIINQKCTHHLLIINHESA